MSLAPIREAPASQFQVSFDATINGCGVGVGHEYLARGFNRQYLAALILNLNVFYSKFTLCQYGTVGQIFWGSCPGLRSGVGCVAVVEETVSDTFGLCDINWARPAQAAAVLTRSCGHPSSAKVKSCRIDAILPRNQAAQHRGKLLRFTRGSGSGGRRRSAF
jgi:hypothetical protein